MATRIVAVAFHKPINLSALNGGVTAHVNNENKQIGAAAGNIRVTLDGGFVVLSKENIERRLRIPLVSVESVTEVVEPDAQVKK